MCGIFVAFNRYGLNQKRLPQYKNAINIVNHRGPDSINYLNTTNCFLAHSRLAIMDLNDSSNQPFHYQNFIITYNGEVFNYKEIRSELQGLGHIFNTDSDTEVVIAAYAEWGVSCFKIFNGMWALAIFDSIKQELIISRDRFGQKPLFVAKFEDNVYFASEFQQLNNLVDKEIDYGLIQMFLNEGTFENEGRTFYQNIQEFPKAHYLTISNTGSWESKEYWTYWSGPVAKTDDESLVKFNSLLSDAVRLRLRSDVPFGILVSGGVDSTIIADYARHHIDKKTRVPAFTYSSNDIFDESGYASVVCDRLDLDLTVSTQEKNPIDYINRLERLVRHLGRGHSSPAIVSIDYLYENMSKRGVRVALDGQGADELLAGYKNYFSLIIPSNLIRGNFRQAYLLLQDQFRFGLVSSTLVFLRIILPPSLRKVMRYFYGYQSLMKNYSHKKIPRWFSLISRNKNPNLLNRYLIWQHDVGLENLLYYGDIVAMRNSIENRSPFLDHRLVDFAFSHDEKLKLHNAIDKYVLRMSSGYQRFKDVLDRTKIGFSSDINEETKKIMINDLRNSNILNWPIFSKNMQLFIMSEKPMQYKFERFLFRVYQLHIWNKIFCEPNIYKNQ
jgi:asparagine synthase (glutamine-hydrolysing)